jgi:superfamily II DNA helicase RecQ
VNSQLFFDSDQLGTDRSYSIRVVDLSEWLASGLGKPQVSFIFMALTENYHSDLLVSIHQLIHITTMAAPVFTYLQSYQILVCTHHRCQYAVPNLSRHLRESHPISLSARNEIITTYRNLQLVRPNQVRSPLAEIPPFQCLGSPIDGFTCVEDDCNFLCASRDSARQHANKQHHWRASKREPTHWQSVKVQTFFKRRDLIRYFIVKAEDSVEDETRHSPSRSAPTSQLSSSIISPAILSSQHLTVEQQSEVNAVAQEWESIQEQHEQTMQKVEVEQASHDQTGWWSLTKWAQHFSQCNIQYLAHASRVPDQDEGLLQEACRVVNLALNRSVTGLSTLHRETRRWLRSPKLSEPDIRPLARLQEPNSQERYYNYWRRFMCYCFRVWLSQQEYGPVTEADDTLPASLRSRRASTRERVVADGDNSDDGNDDELETETSDDLEEEEEENDNDTSISHDEAAASSNTDEVDVMKDARRLFVWTPRQLELMAELYTKLLAHEDEVSDESRVETMLELCQTFIFCTFTASEFTCGLVHFCAILGIDSENNRLRRPADFTYMLAGLVYDARILAVEILLPSDRRDEQGHDPSRREYFLEQRAKYLADGTSTPMSTMISLLAYGKHIAMNEGNVGIVSWSQNRKILYYKGFPIEIALFRSMVHDVIARATDVLWQELMWVHQKAERFEVPLSQIHDDVSFTRRGWSYMTRSEHGLAQGARWMQERLVQLKGQKQLRVEGVWKPRACRRYLRKCDKFLELLLFCIHTTWGQPARGTEILSTRFQNGILQDRNVFVIDARGVIVTRYHKSQALLDRPKVIPRWPAQQVFQLLAIWLAYPRTLRDHLRAQLDQQTISDYIWCDNKGPWETPRLTKVLQRESVKALGHSFGTLDYRHIAVSIGREMVGESFARGYKDEIGEIEEPEVDEEDPLDVQAGRGEIVGGLRYGVPINIISHLSVRSLEAFRPLSEMWHDFLDLGGSSENDERPEIGQTRSSTPIKRLAVSEHQDAEQRGRSRSRRREPGWRHLFTTPSPAIAGGSSSPLHQSTQLVIRTPGHQREGRYATPVVNHTPARIPLNPDEDEETIMSALRKLLKDPQAQFRCDEQRAAAFAVLRGETPLIVVLPTGGGKTLLAALPATLEPKQVIIFVTPFRALTNDMVQRFQQDGIDTKEWQYGDPNPASIVVVSADIAGQYGFLSYAQKLQHSGLLRGIFIDEAHLVVTSSHWRGNLTKLRQLRAITCPMILLTATLPPLQVFELETAMEVRGARIIRSSTTRLRHRYTVQRCTGGQLQGQAIEICRRQLRHMKAGEKGVIYALSRNLCEDLAARLHCGHYHAGAIDRTERLQRWLRDGGLIVATSALGTGVNFSGIVFVFHVDLPWSMSDFAQESGRAGRDGEIVRSIILVEEQSVEAKIQRGDMFLDQSAMAQFVTTRQCRRYMMSEYLDGPELAIVCEDLAGCARCDCCGEGVVEVQASARQYAAERERVQGILDDLVGHCVSCWAQLDDEEQSWREHGLGQCGRNWPGQSMRDLERFRGRISYEKSSHTCHRCGISQRYCATKERVENACQWPNVVVPILVAMVYGEPGGAGTVEARIQQFRELGYEGEMEEGRIARWVGRRHRRPIWGVWVSNGMAVVTRMLLLAWQAIPKESESVEARSEDR